MTSDDLFRVALVALLGSLTLPEPSARSGESLATWRISDDVPTTAPPPTTSSPPTPTPTPTAAPMPTTAPMVSVTERTLNGTSDVLRAFRLPGPALLIVCAKLETGFDEPRVCCLCVDRTLRGAHAVQVLGRANRAASTECMLMASLIRCACSPSAWPRQSCRATQAARARARLRQQCGRDWRRLPRLRACNHPPSRGT
jgi:hypothetical protein